MNFLEALVWMGLWPSSSSPSSPVCIGGSDPFLKLMLPHLSSAKAGPKASQPQYPFSQTALGKSLLMKERGGEERQNTLLEGDWVQFIWRIVPAPLGGPNYFKDPDRRHDAIQASRP